MLKKDNGQSTLEYAVLIVVVVAALMAVKIYMGRGVQGRLRDSVDQIGEQFSAGKTTYKISTEQATDIKTKETFGIPKDGTIGDNATKKQGFTFYQVVTPALTTRKTETDTAEKINTGVKDENLFE